MTVPVTSTALAVTLGDSGTAAAASIGTNATVSGAARELLDFLLSPTSIAVTRSQGMEPAGRP